MTNLDPERVHADLLRDGVVAKAALSGPEERAWLDCDLASLAENWLGDRLDPRALDDARRAAWQARGADERPTSLRRRNEYERCYWLLEEGERAGTISLATSTISGRRLYLASLYVLPPFRGRGVGYRAMRRVMDAASRHGLGLRLDTSWCWQRTVAFYLKLGLWVYMWKRDLSLCWDAGTPPATIEVGAESATLSVPLGDAHVTLVRAHRRGDALEIEEPPESLVKEKRIGEAYWHAESTLALALALHGWPLVRSRREWDRSYFADGGAPEALAYKITIWEAWAHKHGRLVETPRIPGLDYPTWQQLETRWEEQNRDLGLAEPKEP